MLAPRSMGWLCRVSVYRQTSLELDVQCTASDCAMLILARGSPHAQMPEWQTFTSLAFNTLVLQGQAASTQRRRLQCSALASGQVPFAVLQGPAEAPLQVRQSQRMAPLHCMGALTMGRSCTDALTISDTRTIPVVIGSIAHVHPRSAALRMQLCRQWQLSLPQKNWTLSEML